jgi:hypothetical protein
VEDGALLGDVDLDAVEHLLGPAEDVALTGEGAQEGEGFLGDAVLGEVEEEAVELEGEFLEAVGVLREEVAHGDGLHGVVVGLEIRPTGGGGEGSHGPASMEKIGRGATGF